MPLLVVAAVVLAVLPFMQVQLPGLASFVPMMLAVVACFDILSVVLLLAQFRDKGDLRALALSWAYMFSLVVMVGWAAAFPGVFATPGPLGAVASTAPWLWVAWHTAFPVLLAVALTSWPSRFGRPTVAGRRRRVAALTVMAAAAAAGLLVAVVVGVADILPVIIDGTDTSEMTRLVGPVMLPVVAVATWVVCAGARRRGGPERWAALAATASLADVILTLFSDYRFSVGWYAGRSMTVVSAGVVLIALLGEFSGVKRRLAQEGERLSAQLARTDQLERLQSTLLSHMAEGVLMQDAHARIVASNPAAQALLGGGALDLAGILTLDPRWRLLRADGQELPTEDSPVAQTLSTGVGRRNQIVGVRLAARGLRWLSVNTAPVRDPAGAVDYVVSSMTDVTEQHNAQLAAAGDHQARRTRIDQVLEAGGPSMLFQPIVALASGQVIGTEALARFKAEPYRPPNEWFHDAAEAGLGVELELAAIRNALEQLGQLPAGTYLSVNAGPETVTSTGLFELLSHAPCSRVVLELTEHVGVEDYATLLVALQRLRATGLRLAVDDAGAGFASLRHILSLRPDIIKLDIGLVRGITDDPGKRALAVALVAFGSEIDAVVLAEGIESAADLHTLRALGVRYGQGYHLGRPALLPLPTLLTLLPSRHAIHSAGDAHRLRVLNSGTGQHP